MTKENDYSVLDVNWRFPVGSEEAKVIDYLNLDKQGRKYLVMQALKAYFLPEAAYKCPQDFSSVSERKMVQLAEYALKERVQFIDKLHESHSDNLSSPAIESEEDYGI